MLSNSNQKSTDKISRSKHEFKADGSNDKYLWQSVKEDSELSFSILYKRYTKLLYNYGMHSCRDHELVLDCLQEMFTSIWEKRRDLSDVYAVNTYLFRSFRRLLIKKITWRRRFSLSLDNRPARSFEVAIPIEYTIEQEEDRVAHTARLRHSMDALTKRQREAVFLKFYNGLSYADIASIMDLQVDSVYNVISRAIDSLRITMVR